MSLCFLVSFYLFYPVTVMHKGKTAKGLLDWKNLSRLMALQLVICVFNYQRAALEITCGFLASHCLCM